MGRKPPAIQRKPINCAEQSPHDLILLNSGAFAKLGIADTNRIDIERVNLGGWKTRLRNG